MQGITLGIVLAPLIGSLIAGLLGKRIGRVAAHRATIGGVGLSCLLSFIVFKAIVINGGEPYNATLYTWLISDGIPFPDPRRDPI